MEFCARIREVVIFSPVDLPNPGSNSSSPALQNTGVGCTCPGDLPKPWFGSPASPLYCMKPLVGTEPRSFVFCYRCIILGHQEHTRTKGLKDKLCSESLVLNLKVKTIEKQQQKRKKKSCFHTACI